MINESIVKTAARAFNPTGNNRAEVPARTEFGNYRRKLKPQPIKIDPIYYVRLRRRIIGAAVLLILAIAVIYILLQLTGVISVRF